jgi:hypothetical protein
MVVHVEETYSPTAHVEQVKHEACPVVFWNVEPREHGEQAPVSARRAQKKG